MGLPLTVALNIIECSKNIQKESVLCLGEQTVKFSIRDLINSKKIYNHNVDLDKFNDLDSTKLFTQKNKEVNQLYGRQIYLGHIIGAFPPQI